MADVWFANLDVTLPAADAAWLADRLRALAGDVDGASGAASSIEAAVEDRGSADISLDIAEIDAVRLALAEGAGSVEGSPALALLVERLSHLDL